MAFHYGFTHFLVGGQLWWSPLVSSRVRLSTREFFDPYICSIEKENWLNHNCQRRSCPCAYIFDKFFFTKPKILLQSVWIRKGFGDKKIKNFSIPLVTTRISFFSNRSSSLIITIFWVLELNYLPENSSIAIYVQ